VTLFHPLVPDRRAPLAAANPIVKLAGAGVLMGVLLVSADVVVPAVLLTVELGALAFTGLRPDVVLRRTAPMLAVAIAIGLVNGVFGSSTGPSVLEVGPLRVTAAGLSAGLAAALRLLAIVLAGVLAFVTTDPTDLADALVQQVKVSPRFAIGTLAAMRLLPILAEEWQTIGLARRARGLEARSPRAAVALLGGRMLSLLVAAIRRAVRMALAIESRGFGSRPCRTAARPQRVRAADWVLLGAAVLAGVLAIAVSVASGSWRFFLA